MKNKIVFIFLFNFFFQFISGDDSQIKVILNDKRIINEEVKSIDEKEIELASELKIKNSDVQEIFFRNKSEKSPATILILNNESLLYLNDFYFVENKVNFSFLSEDIEIPIGVIKGVLYKNLSKENVIIWKRSFALEIRKTDMIFVLKDNVLIPIEGIIKEIDNDKIKIFWGGNDKTISLDKVSGVLFASEPENSTLNFEVQTIDGSKIFCHSVFLNKNNMCKINFKDEEGFSISGSKISRILFNNRKSIYLSSLEPIEVVTENILIELSSNWEKDQSIWKKTLGIGTKTYSKGIGVHSYCKLKFKIPENCIEFITDFGIDKEVENNSGCVFKIMIDKKVYLDEVVKSSDGAKNLRIELPKESQEIILLVEPGLNLDIGDHGVWGNARFIKN